MISEEAARKRWCPFAMVWGSPCSFNREHERELPKAARCIGSECMAWVGATNGHGDCGLKKGTS